MTCTEANAIYNKFDELPDGKITLEGEGLWCKKLPNGMVVLNNNPLSDNYRYQDIINGVVVIYRRWRLKLRFRYPVVENAGTNLKRRKAILKALKPFGEVSFFVEGMGYILLEKNVIGLQEKMCITFDAVVKKF